MTESMTESEAIERLNCLRLYMQITDKNSDSKFLDEDYEANAMAIKALEKQEKIKEAFEKWRTESGGYIYADDEATELIHTLNQILRSDE